MEPQPPAEQVLRQLGQLLSQRPGVITELGALLEAAEPRWLFGAGSPAALGELAAALSAFAALPEREQDAVELRDGDGAYAAAAERAADVGGVFLRLLAKLETAKADESLGRAVEPVLRRVMGHIYVLAVTHIEEAAWTGVRSRAVATELLGALVRAAGCGTVAELLRGRKEEEEGGFAAVMRLLRPRLGKDTWKRNPATKHVFSWTLLHITRPWLSQHLEHVLPASLLISDDFREENKVLGVHCLHHIVLNVPGADLCQFNRAQVVYHALYNHLYSREAPLIQCVLCVDRLGILIARHLKRLERVILGYLEVSDGPEEEARLGILETLQCTIEHAWPRMPCRLPVLLKALLKMMWDVHTDQGSTPEPVRAALLQRATECLILLDRCSEGQVKILLEGVYSCCEENRVRECIRRVQENT
ncbi:TELO2-interacting protein 2 isoform X2 [Lagopus leucura]|uniref:TELO2-interacting protein 2 isoform X2 n=1 Tax=Lagopus leucura TaxID=30410 RepID=UPI001C67B926|nr:TELO2-interacting protein 2 isoform X2 [Lagopus leucura]